MAPLMSSGNDFETMFDLAPVSLWLEDYSALKLLFDDLRAQGVTDLMAHVQANPGLAQRCAECLKVLRVNQRTLEVFSADSQEQLIANMPQVFRDDTFHRLMTELEQFWLGGMRFSNLTVNYALDGRRLDVQVHGRILPGHEATWDRVMVSLEDVTVRQQALHQLAYSEEYARGLFEHSPVSLWVEDFSSVKRLLDEARTMGIEDFRTFVNVHPEFVNRCMEEIRVIDVNQQTLRVFGAPDKETLMSNLSRVFRDEMHDSFTEQLVDLWNGKTTQMREVINYSLKGDLINIHMQFSVLDEHLANWDMVLVSLIDITARKKAEAYLEYLGKHDTLTRLRNRAYYGEELNRLSRRGPWPVSVLVLDLNGLKQINDEEGHAVGDALLRRVGEVLNKSVDAPNCAARIGGDEFVVLMPGLDAHAAEQMTERIGSMVELNNQFYPGHRLSLAIGQATCSSGDQLEAAVNQADQAMYAAKAQYYRDNEIERRAPGARRP